MLLVICPLIGRAAGPRHDALSIEFPLLEKTDVRVACLPPQRSFAVMLAVLEVAFVLGEAPRMVLSFSSLEASRAVNQVAVAVGQSGRVVASRVRHPLKAHSLFPCILVLASSCLLTVICRRRALPLLFSLTYQRRRCGFSAILRR